MSDYQLFRCAWITGTCILCKIDAMQKDFNNLQAKLELAKAFIKAECYCEMDGDMPKHCKNCQFLTTI